MDFQTGRAEQGCFYLEVLQGLWRSRMMPCADKKQNCSSALSIGSIWLPTKWSRAKTSCAGASSCIISINIWERDGKHYYCATNQNGNYVICLNCAYRSRRNRRSCGWGSGRTDLPAASVPHTPLCPRRASLSPRLAGQLALHLLIISGACRGT